MASTTALWLSIDLAFSEIEQLCVEARAAQMALDIRRVEAELLRSVAGGRVESRRPQPELNREGDVRVALAAELSRDLAFRDAHPEGPNLVELRAKLRKRLQWLKSKLSEALTEHEVHYVLLPFVIYIDELVTSVTRGQAARWEPLQSELYEIDNGGELFFTILDDHLRKSETHPIIFQMFYFCLSDGFVGMCESDPRKIDEYKARLAERIPLLPVSEQPPERAHGHFVELVPFPWQVYAWAVAAIVAGWMLLHWAALLS
jgi:type IV/VI secretion system ImpK/VasF family protein